MTSLSPGCVFSMRLSIDLFTWTAFTLLFANYSLSVLFSFWKMLTAEWTRCWFWSDNQWLDHFCLQEANERPFKMVPWILLAIGICGAMFILHNQSYAQIYHSWLLARVIRKVDIMLEVNTYPLVLYCCSISLLRLLDMCWLLCRPGRDIRTDSAMNHSVGMYLEQQGRDL